MNLRGGRQMRLGRIAAAVATYRSFVLKSGCTWTRPELPDMYRVNFATALLLHGHPAGCLSILAEVRDPGDPGVLSLRAEIAAWEKRLSWWHRLNWRFGRIEPAVAPPVLSNPGVLESTAHRFSSTPPTAAASVAGVSTVL
ncbi:MAG: hypothetical protein Fues2KO_31230 [Fuerstiella sp.]